jgi:predicted DNA repair protein MutK
MAGTSLLALIDDIATLLDDVAVMTKVAAKKTAGVLGDDLAVNAEQVSGVSADRELPVVWAVFKGSMLNKLILVPTALLISAFLPWAVVPLLMLGGAYLCFEGVEKVLHHFSSKKEAEHHALVAAVADTQVDLLTFERAKIKGAIRTDFILSAEIIAIALGTVAAKPMSIQISVLSLLAVVMTLGVYGFVAGIVKLDDAGLHLSKRGAPLKQFGLALVFSAPVLMKLLSIFGTIAMFLVGGGIVLHGLPPLEHWVAHNLTELGTTGQILQLLAPAVVGVLVGVLAVAVYLPVQKMLVKKASS